VLNAGLHAMEIRLPQYMAICFGGKAAVALQAHVEST